MYAIHTPSHTRNRPRRPRTVRAARMIERRPAVAKNPVIEPVTPIIRFDDEPLFIGSHLSAQMIQREWRWW